MGRKQIKFGKIISFYLSTEAIAKLKRMSDGNPSRFLDALILSEWAVNNPELQAEKEVENAIN